MRSIIAPLVVLGSLLGAVYGQSSLIINTPIPAPVQCQPTLLTWGGGTPPYFIRCGKIIVDPNDKTSTLVDFGQLTNTSLTWVDLLPAGTNMLLTIKDNTGFTQSSAPFAVGTGGSASCTSTTGSSVSQSSPGSTASAPPKSTSSISTVSTPTVPTPPVSTSATSTKPSSSTATLLSGSGSSASASAPGTSQTPSGSGSNSVPAAAAAAVVGAVFAALF